MSGNISCVIFDIHAAIYECSELSRTCHSCYPAVQVAAVGAVAVVVAAVAAVPANHNDLQMSLLASLTQ